MLMARDTARDEAQKLHRKWLKHQAFMAELARNKEWLAKIEQEGQELIQEKPELRSVVQQKLEEIRECWSDLESTTKAKARQLFENNKPEPAMKSYSDLDNQLSHLEQQPPQLEQAHHLPTFNEQLQKFQTMESQIGDFYKDVGELGSLQGVCLPQRGLMAGDREGGEQSGVVETRIVRLIEPLKERRRILLASKEMHQVAQDLEDEILWIQERLPLASSKEYGNNLQSVQQHVKKNQTLQRELTGRRARVEEVLDRAGIIASLRTPEVDFVREGAGHVRQLWEVLRLEVERRSVMLDAVLQAQQYYSEAAKVESWLSGQKLHLVNEEKGTDEASTLQLLKSHLALEQTVETYAETVGMLSQQCQRLLELGHPESEQITKQQSHIDRLYVSLKDMVEHRKTKLEQQYWLYQLNKEVEELEKWITEREAVASSTDLGHDLEDVTVLQEKFTKFSSETNNIGQQRMEQVNKMVNEMIDCGHTDAATIAEWKDGLNESWADLLELMETRRQMLAASHQLHKFFTDCKEVLAQIAGKMRQLPEVRACQASIANPATLQRLMHSFEHALQLLVAQVRQLQENAAQLRTIYAGEKAEAIMIKEQEVMEAWKELLSSCEASRVQVTSVTDKVQFFSVVRENLMWMEGIMGQIGWDEPRDVVALEVMLKQHQELKAKMDGRSKTIQQCADLGKILLAAGNPAAEEIKEKLDSLLAKQKDLAEKWDKHQERLQRKQEMFQFAQETVKAEAWLKAKEPLITSREPEGGQAQAQTDEVEQLILRHEAFRKAAVTWKERFSSLRQLSAAEKKKEEEKKTTPLSSRRMFPLSCLTPSVPSASATSSFLRQTVQAHIEHKPTQTSLELGATPAAQRLSSTLASYAPVINGSGYHGLDQHCSGKLESSTYLGMNHQAAGGGDGCGYPALNPQSGGGDTSSYLGMNHQTGGGAESSGYLGLSPGGSLGSSGFLAQSGGIMDPKMAYAWQHLKADFMQPRINHIHKAVNPLLEASRAQREQYGDIPMADMVGPESGLELLHGRLQRDPRGSRSDPQMDHLRREREYKLGRQTSSEQEIQARLNELPLIVRQERYRRRLERQSSSEQEGSGKPRLQRQDSSDLEGSIKEGSDKRSGEKRSTMAEIVEQVQEREAAQARGEPYRPPSSLSAPVTRFDGRPRARDRPKPRRRPRPKEPEETRRSRSAPATGAPTTPQPPSHTAHNEGFLYRKKATTSDLEAQQRSPNSKSWVNVYCVLTEGKLTFYKDARNHTATYNEETPLDLGVCSFDASMGYKKKKNVFVLNINDGNNFVFHAKDEEDLKAWTSNITTCISEHEEMAKWDKPGTSSTDPDRSERKEKSEGDADARSERSELAEGEERSEKERSEKGDGSEKLDTSEIADKVEGGAGGSSTSGKSK
ncbi:spectrin beta chain, non-erythrocytic 4 [Centroberyx gerrardi]|uniref:spectrin beta chain, non-erythrocytic 4 n=1 Tax=Centroberyx gerrardi TaxID=166262 RepID=UPI003AAEF4B4